MSASPIQEALDLGTISSDLMERRHELSVQLDQVQMAMTRLKTEIGAIDTVLRLFGLGSPLHKAVLPLYRRNTSQLVLTALRESPRPLTAIELAKIVLTERQMSPQDDKLVQAIARRVRASLHHYRKRGVLVATEATAERSLGWQFAKAPAPEM